MNAQAPAGVLDAHPVMAPGILRGFHLLEADAGTGKTWTIAGLVARAIVENGTGIDRILIVTFTNAARDELGARVRDRIARLASSLEDRLAGRPASVDEAFCAAYAPRVEDPEAALAALRVALARMDQAAIQTIHAFCHRAIAEHTLSIGVRAEGEPGDRRNAWIARGLADWWREMAGQASPGTLGLLRACGVSPAGVASRLARIDAAPGARLRPPRLDWRAFEPRVAALRARLAASIASDTDALIDWIGRKGEVDGKRFQRRYLDTWLDKLGRWAGAPALDAPIPDVVEKLGSENWRGNSGTMSPPPLGIVEVCDALDAVRAALADLDAQVALDAWDAISARRTELKGEAGGIDHDDLLRAVDEALSRPGSGEVLAESLRERFPVALVDECQDTDSLQWNIFRRIYDPARMADGGALILVGDPKQAIYAFRNADVYTYLQARAEGPVRHALDENQRASSALIAAVNALFSREQPFLVPEIGFGGAREGRKPRREFRVDERVGGAPMTVLMLDGGDEARMIDQASAREQSVDATVGEIARLLGDGAATIDGRPLRPADIALLVGSHREGTLLKRALAAAGIGAVEISRDSVFASRECAELIRLLAAVADPADAGLLRSALLTTLAGFDATTLLDQAHDDARGRVVEALVAARDGWSRTGPQAALRRLLAALGAPPRLAGLRDGDRRMTNLLHLLELLSGGDEPREGAHAALRWLGRMRSDPTALGSEAVELRLESDDDLVRIVTVHKSKGLEFPVVFVPFAWSGREPRAGDAIRYHEAEGAGWTQVVDLRDAPDDDAIDRAAREEHAERLRVLYVALTRAEHRCYVCWGAASGAQFSSMAWLLCALDPGAQKAWQSKSKDLPALTPARALEAAHAWQRAAAFARPGAIAVQPAADVPRAAAARAVERAEQALSARPFAAAVPAPWVRTSFTAIAAALRAGEADAPSTAVERPDHDQSTLTVRPPDEAPDEAADASIRFSFPAGAQAGVCLHGILEHTDFANGVDPAVVGEWLARGGYRDVDSAAVAGWLDEVLGAALPDLGGGSLRLADVGRSATMRELEFLLGADRVDDARVVDAVAAEFPLDARAAGARWSGFLHGFVDLVFEHAGRWYIVDWKSNRLGGAADAYGPDRMSGAIGESAYALQFCLYSLALHRLLGRRLAGYEHARHFGGVHYVFLRGAGLRDADARPVGVYSARPSLALLDRLDRAFGGRG